MRNRNSELGRNGSPARLRGDDGLEWAVLYAFVFMSVLRRCFSRRQLWMGAPAHLVFAFLRFDLLTLLFGT